MQGSLDPMGDWSELWSADQIASHWQVEEVRTVNGVRQPKTVTPMPFTGEGWYFLKDQTILVAHTKHKRGEEPLFRVIVWSRVNDGPLAPTTIMNNVYEASLEPAKLDQR